MIYPTKKKANDIRLTGGKPQYHLPGVIQPSYPMKKRWAPAKNMAINNTFLELIQRNRSLSLRNWELKLTLYIHKKMKANTPVTILMPVIKFIVPSSVKKRGNT